MTKGIRLYLVLGAALIVFGFSSRLGFAANAAVPSYTIAYIKENKIEPGIFETEGYVTFINQIKGCKTPDSVCPPGSDTSVILVNEKKNGPSDTAIRIKITKDTQGLQKGQRYRFTVEAGSGTMPGQSKLQKLDLIKFEPAQLQGK